MSVETRLSRATTRILGMAAAAAVSLIVLVIADASVLEAWLFGFMLLAGLSTGALALLLAGRILGELWLQPIRDELEAIADLMAIMAILAVPILVHPEALYPWAGDPASANSDWLDPQFFLLRGAVYLAVWIAVATLAGRRRNRSTASAIGLVILIPTLSLAVLDWLASREPEWISGLYGPAFTVSQLLAAMAFGLMMTLVRPGHPARGQAESLRIALLSLALLTLWAWFTQFLIVWMADLPPESAWYLSRAGDWLVLEAIAVAALLTTIPLLMAPHPGRLRLLVISGLLLIQHVAHLAWLIRPTAPHAVPALVDAAVVATLVGLWFLFFSVELARRPNISTQTS